MSVPRRIAAFLELAAQDADAARTLAATKKLHPLETYLPYATTYRYPT